MKKLLLLLILAGLVAGGIYYYKNWRKHFLQHRVPELVFLQSDSLYRIAYKNVEIDEISGDIRITDLDLVPDTTYKKISDSTLPRSLLRVHIPELHITGLHTDDAVMNKQIIAGKIQISSPAVTMYNNRYGPVIKEADKVSTSDMYRIILRSLDRIKIDTILITKANYQICNWIGLDTTFAGTSIDAQLYDIDISDSTSRDTSRVLFSKRADLNVKNIVIGDRKGRYHFLFNDIALNAAQKSFTVKSIAMVPVLGEAAFMRSIKYQLDRYNLDFLNLQFKNINVQELLAGGIEADELVMGNASFKIFRDKTMPTDNKSKVGKYPQQALLKIPFDLSIRKLIINHGFIEYKEKNPKSDSSGKIRFHDVYAVLYNVTNRQQEIAVNPVCALDFSSKFLDKAALKARLNMYLNSTNGRFTIKGTMKGAEATVFNLISKPLGLAEFEDGTVNSLDFDFKGNDYVMNGSLLMLYDGLRISLLKKDEENNEYKKKKLASLVANIAIRDANPQRNKPPKRVTLVNFPRDPQKSFFNLLWKSIFAGVKETVGMDDPNVH